ncbi:MAG TPA: hypothetical protein PKJ72_10960, partial [Deltaproteobacteria bacterium]|nr:hypothetical protein [Deltaproteobacteria bacterium]
RSTPRTYSAGSPARAAYPALWTSTWAGRSKGAMPTCRAGWGRTFRLTAGYSGRSSIRST